MWLIVFISVLSASMVFFVWVFDALRRDGPRIQHRVEALTEIRDAVRDLENRAQQLASPIGNPALMWRIAHRGRKASESEIEFLRRRLFQISSLVSELERHGSTRQRGTHQFAGQHQ